MHYLVHKQTVTQSSSVPTFLFCHILSLLTHCDCFTSTVFAFHLIIIKVGFHSAVCLLIRSNPNIQKALVWLCCQKVRALADCPITLLQYHFHAVVFVKHIWHMASSKVLTSQNKIVYAILCLDLWNLKTNVSICFESLIVHQPCSAHRVCISNGVTVTTKRLSKIMQEVLCKTVPNMFSFTQSFVSCLSL